MLMSMLSWETLTGVYNELSKVLYHEVQGCLFAIDDDEGIIQYDFDTDTWKLQRPINELPMFSMKNPVAIDSKNDMIYVFSNYSVIKFSIHPNTPYEINYDFKSLFTVKSASNGIMINDEFHVIQDYGAVGLTKNMHIKYDEQCNSPISLPDDYTEIISKNKDCNIGQYGIVKLKHKIMIFGGREQTQSKDGDIVDQICEYDVKTSKWIKLGIKLPQPLYSMGCTEAVNGQYVLIFGGKKCDSSTNVQTHDIWIYSVKHQTFRKSKIRCPSKYKCQAIAVREGIRDELCVFGFARVVWKNEKITDSIFPPRYLLKLINRFYLDEYIHIFSGWDHWRINVFDIL